MPYHPKMKMLEEIRNAREQTYALDPAFFCLFEKRSKKQTAGAMSFNLRTNNDRAYLSEMLPIDMKRSAANELTLVALNDGKGVDVLANFEIRPMQ